MILIKINNKNRLIIYQVSLFKLNIKINKFIDKHKKIMRNRN
jgi:hypothetical protein